MGAVNNQDNRAQNSTDKYLTFRLDSEEFGLEILKVREIIGLMDITAVPRVPKYIRGVINLRGKVIPVIDLRLKLGLEEIDYTDRTCIIVVETLEDGEIGQVGVVVDSVSEVLSISPDQMEKSLALESEVNSDFILGMARTESGLKILLDTDKTLAGIKEIST